MSQTPALLIGGLVTASVGLIAGMMLWLGPARSPAQAVPNPVAPAQPRPAAHDSAARQVRADGDDDEPVTLQQPARPPVQNPQPRGPTAVPAPPDPATLAAQGLFFALRDKVVAEAQGQLDGERAALRRACWRSKLTGGARSAKFGVSASFDATGSVVALAISDPSEGGAAGVAQCLRQRVIDLKVAAPGTGMTVDMQLQLP